MSTRRTAIVGIALAMLLALLPAVAVPADEHTSAAPMAGIDAQNTNQGRAVSPVDPGIKWVAELEGYDDTGGIIDGNAAHKPYVLTDAGLLLVRARDVADDGRAHNDHSRYVLIALDPDDGTVVWERTHTGFGCVPAIGLDGTVWASMQLVEDETEEEGDNGEVALVGLDPATGELIDGKRFTPQGGFGVSTTGHCTHSIVIALDGTVIYRPSHIHQDTLFAVDPDDATQRWMLNLRTETGRSPGHARVAIAPEGTPGEGSLYIGVRAGRDLEDDDVNAELLEIDVATGDIVDRVETLGGGSTLGGWSTREVIADDQGGVIVSTQDSDQISLRHVSRYVHGDDGLRESWSLWYDRDDGSASHAFLRDWPEARGVAGDVVVGSHDGDGMFGVSVASGAPVFDYTATSFDNRDSLLTDEQGNGLLTTFQGPPLESFDPAGAPRWSVPEGALPEVRAVGPIAADGTLYLNHVLGGTDDNPVARIAAIDSSGGLLAPGAGSVTGVVSDVDTHNPIEGATVSVSGAGSAQTNAGGEYTVTDVPAGERTVTASASGYRSASQTVTVTAGESVDAFFQLSPVDEPPGEEPDVPDRISGRDRFETAADISDAFIQPGAPVVYVATGGDFPDALAGGVPAALDRAPVLLVTRDSIPQPTADELRRLQPGRIVVFGGTAAVGQSVFDQLGGFTQGAVTRIAGTNRFETATEISRSRFAPTPERHLSVFIATGQNFPDALAGVPPAAVHQGPILLVGRDLLPQTTRDELRRLQPQNIFVLGGSGAVSQAVFDELRGLAPDVMRVFGDNRFSTAVEVGGLVTGQDPPSPLTVFIATGGNFPDALAGGAVAGAVPGPIFLVPTDAAPQIVLDEIGRLRPDRLIIFGGFGAVSQNTENQLRARMDG